MYYWCRRRWGDRRAGEAGGLTPGSEHKELAWRAIMDRYPDILPRDPSQQAQGADLIQRVLEAYGL